MPRVKADREVLQRFATLAEQLGFNTPEIKALKGDFDHLPITNIQESIPFLIKHRCGLPHIETFEEDRKYLFLHNLCHESDEVGEGITSFFVLKSWFTAFFDSSRWTRPILSVESSNLLSATYGYVDKEDVNIGGKGRGIPNQRERQEEQQQIREVRSPQMDTDEHMQETTELEQQRLSGHAIDANQILEGQEAFFSSFPIYDCHGTSFPLTEGLSTSPHLPRYLSDRSHDLWTVYIARPLWPLLVSFPLYATTVLSPKSYSSPRDNDA
jgi:hypothetical protein